MCGGAVVRRAVLLIAAALLFAAPALAQNEASAIVEKFAGDAEREKTSKAEVARKAATEAKAKKDAERKAAYEKKVLEVRKDAEAQRAAAQARHRKEEARRTEGDVLTRARQETEDAKATEEIRSLIEEAEAARIRAEDMLAQEASAQGPVPPARPAGTEAVQDVDRSQLDAVLRAREAEAERAKVAAQAARRAAESHDRRVKLTRVSQVRKERLAAQARRAQEAEAAVARAEQDARLTLRRAAENRRMLKQFARVRQVREARLAAQQLAQRLALEDAQRQRLAQAAAAAERATAAEAARFAELELQRQAQEARVTEAKAAEVRAEEVRLALQASREEAENRVVSEAREPDRRLAETQPPLPVVPPAPPREPAASAPLEGRAGLGGEPEWRVTVLMTMTPGSYGIRRGANIADPVLCAIDGCYVSTGAGSAARFMPRRKALGVGNTLGQRAGACRQSLSCVFRAVALDVPGALQPVDLHILKHDRKQPQMITADSDCRLVDGRLACNRGYYAEDYVLWIVPERLAAAVGPEVLQRALRGGLNTSRSAEASPRSSRR